MLTIKMNSGTIPFNPTFLFIETSFKNVGQISNLSYVAHFHFSWWARAPMSNSFENPRD